MWIHSHKYENSKDSCHNISALSAVRFACMKIKKLFKNSSNCANHVKTAFFTPYNLTLKVGTDTCKRGRRHNPLTGDVRGMTLTWLQFEKWQHCHGSRSEDTSRRRRCHCHPWVLKQQTWDTGNDIRLSKTLKQRLPNYGPQDKSSPRRHFHQ